VDSIKNKNNLQQSSKTFLILTKKELKKVIAQPVQMACKSNL